MPDSGTAALQEAIFSRCWLKGGRELVLAGVRETGKEEVEEGQAIGGMRVGVQGQAAGV